MTDDAMGMGSACGEVAGIGQNSSLACAFRAFVAAIAMALSFSSHSADRMAPEERMSQARASLEGAKGALVSGEFATAAYSAKAAAKVLRGLSDSWDGKGEAVEMAEAVMAFVSSQVGRPARIPDIFPPGEAGGIFAIAAWEMSFKAGEVSAGDAAVASYCKNGRTDFMCKGQDEKAQPPGEGSGVHDRLAHLLAIHRGESDCAKREALFGKASDLGFWRVSKAWCRGAEEYSKGRFREASAIFADAWDYSVACCAGSQVGWPTMRPARHLMLAAALSALFADKEKEVGWMFVRDASLEFSPYGRGEAELSAFERTARSVMGPERLLNGGALPEPPKLPDVRLY